MVVTIVSNLQCVWMCVHPTTRMCVTADIPPPPCICQCMSAENTNLRFSTSARHQHINRIKVNTRWLPWWCCYGDQSKRRGELMGGCALRLPTPPHPPKKKKTHSRKRAENELRGWLLPGGDCRENVKSVFIAAAWRLQLFSLSLACYEIIMC